MSTSGQKPLIEPFYFGDKKPIFGCYHRPQRQAPRSCTVLLCHAMGDEYIRFHRALRQLAVLLATAGFPVLRFDFYGCGDSAGDAQEWRIPQWEADLTSAIAEARRRSGAHDVATVGLRLGATVAATVGATREDICATVLWDPVLNGPAHLHELQKLHSSMLRRAHVLRQAPGQSTPPQPEILGFPLCPLMQADIDAIDLMTLPGKPASQVLLLESNPNSRQAAFARHLRECGATVQHLTVANPQLWLWEEGVGKVVVPHSILQGFTAWLDEVCP